MAIGSFRRRTMRFIAFLFRIGNLEHWMRHAKHSNGFVGVRPSDGPAFASVPLDLKQFNQAVLELYATGLHPDNFADRASRFVRAVLGYDACAHGEMTPETCFDPEWMEHLCGGRFREHDRILLEMLRPHLFNARSMALACAEILPERFDAAAFVRHGLTARQADVLAWMARGKSNGEISQLLGLRLQTVKGYVTAIFNQLGVDNRYAAILCALEWLRDTKEWHQAAS